MSILKKLLNDEIEYSNNDLSISLDTLNVSLELKDITNDIRSLNEMDLIVFNLEDISNRLNENVSNENHCVIKDHLRYLLKDFPDEITEDTLNDVSSEGVKDLGKKVVSAVKSGIKTINNKIRGWFDKVFKAANEVNSKCDKLISIMKKEIPDDKEPSNPDFGYDLGNFLSSNQKVNDILPNIRNLVEDMKEVVNNEKITQIFNDYYKGLLDLTDDINKRVGEKDLSERIMGQVAGLSVSAVNELADLPKSTGSGPIPKSVETGNYEVKKHGCYPGNKTLYSIKPKNEENTFDEKSRARVLNIFDKCGLHIGKYSDSEYSSSGSYPSISSNVVSSMLASAKELISSVYGYKDKIGKAEGMKNNVLEEIDWTLAEVDFSFEGGTAIETLLRSMGNKIVQHMDQPRMEMVDIALSTALKICNFSEIAIKHYKD